MSEVNVMNVRVQGAIPESTKKGVHIRVKRAPFHVGRKNVYLPAGIADAGGPASPK